MTQFHPTFSGTFSNIHTFWFANDTVKIKGGLASENLEALHREVTEKHPKVHLCTDAYENPATLRITGCPSDVENADQFVMQQLDKNNVIYDYQP